MTVKEIDYRNILNFVIDSYVSDQLIKEKYLSFFWNIDFDKLLNKKVEFLIPFCFIFEYFVKLLKNSFSLENFVYIWDVLLKKNYIKNCLVLEAVFYVENLVLFKKKKNMDFFVLEDAIKYYNSRKDFSYLKEILEKSNINIYVI